MESLSELMHRRRSHRKYSSEPLTEEQVRQLMQAPLMAPSSKRCTPWEFVLVSDEEKKNALGLSRAANSAFAAQAALVVVVTADTEKTDTWIEDASIAASYLQLQAEEMGLGSCWIHLRNRFTADGEATESYVRRMLGIPEKFGIVCMIAIGEKVEEKRPFDDEKLQWDKLHINQF